MFKLLLEYRNSNIPRERTIYLKSVQYFIGIIRKLTICEEKAIETAEALQESIKDYKIYKEQKCVTLNQSEIF